MPRKYAKRRSTRSTARRKYAKRTPMYRRPSTRHGTTKVVYQKMTYEDTSLAIGSLANTGTGAVLYFNPSSIAQFMAFAQLYDLYKIFKIVVRLEPTANQNPMVSASEPSGGVNTTYYNGSIHSVIDYSDNNPPSSIATLEGCQTYKRTQFTRKHVRVVYPKMPIATIAQVSTAINGRFYEPCSKHWFSTDDIPNVYGLKLYADPVADVNLAKPYIIKVYYDFYLAFKNQV